jgi:hypothetical protein
MTAHRGDGFLCRSVDSMRDQFQSHAERIFKAQHADGNDSELAISLPRTIGCRVAVRVLPVAVGIALEPAEADSAF